MGRRSTNKDAAWQVMRHIGRPQTTAYAIHSTPPPAASLRSWLAASRVSNMWLTTRDADQ